ncbi:hypothetical protein [Microbacterium gilvum]|uniref:Uncharacterized protein n=1 Tax=Microbacterium gilvum TaxID=1336204 RepID=A0ABP8ZQQ5_9MICO
MASVPMVTARVALVVTSVGCLAQSAVASAAALTPVHNGATLLGAIAGLAAVATLAPVRRAASVLVVRVCFDCRDGRHLACDGCDCTEDHQERAVAVRHGA